MRYRMTIVTVNTIPSESVLDKVFEAFKSADWSPHDLKELKEKGEIDIQDYVHKWGTLIKSNVKLEKVSDN